MLKQEEFDDLQKEYIDHITQYLKKTGEVFPHISLFGKVVNKEDEGYGKAALIHVPIPDKYVSEEGEKEFLENVIPDLIKEVKSKFQINAVAWSAEALRKVVTFISQTKKEVLINEITACIDDKPEQIFLRMNEIHRSQQVNEKGNLIDVVELTPLEPTKEDKEEISQRYKGLLNKFKE